MTNQPNPGPASDPNAQTRPAAYPQRPQAQQPYPPQPYPQPPYGQGPYGQAPHGQAPHGQAPYAQHPYGGMYGATPGAPFANAPAKSGFPLMLVALLVFGVVGVAIFFVAVGGSLLPRGARASSMARNPQAVNAALSQVQTLRSQLALYTLQHQDRKPALAQLQDGWGVLVRRTYEDGSFAPDGPSSFRDSRGRAHGPYLQQPPVNPLTNSSKVVAAGNATSDAGWTYDETTGQVWAVSPADTREIRIANTHGGFEVVKPGR